MHIEFLVEDRSCAVMLSHLAPKILGNHSTYRIKSYAGIGHIPRNKRSAVEARTTMLLNNLPRMLRAYGQTFEGYGYGYPAAVVVVCDLDKRNLQEFFQTLEDILQQCHHKPETDFCIAIEESEAWLLGDRRAVLKAFPQAKIAVLDAYVQDSICGTWKHLADAVCPGGATALTKKPYPEIGAEKSRWAESIGPHMCVEQNISPSFQKFHSALRLRATTNNIQQ